MKSQELERCVCLASGYKNTKRGAIGMNWCLGGEEQVRLKTEGCDPSSRLQPVDVSIVK